MKDVIKDNILDEISVTPRSTVFSYSHYKSESYSLPLMLSEFIDNSISSWEKSINENNVNGLEIYFVFYKFYEDGSDEEQRIIFVKDNAGGMSLDDLKKSCEMYDTEGKSENDLNQYGIGMKSAMSWLGPDSIVATKKEQDDFILTADFITSNKNNRDEWKIPIKKIRYSDENKYKLDKRGTSIIVSSVSRDRFDIFENVNDRNKRINFIKAFLGWKYKYYLKQGLLIKFDFINDEKGFKAKKGFDNFLIDSFEIPFWKKSDFINLIKENNKNNENFDELILRKRFEQKIKKLQQDNGNPNSLEYKICDLILNDKEVKITYKLSLDVPNSKNSELEIKNLGIISSSKLKNFGYKDLQGLSIFHHNRGIDIGPFCKNLFSGRMPRTYAFSSSGESKMSDSSLIRLTGETSVKDVQPEINKYITLFSESEKASLRLKLEEIWKKDFFKVLRIILDTENEFKYDNKPTKFMNEDIGKKIGADSNNKLNQETNNEVDFCMNEEESKWKYHFKYDNESYIFFLIENNRLTKAFDYSEIAKNEIEIKYNYFHSIWFPLNEKKGEISKKIRNIIHPWVIALCLIEIFIKENEKKSNKRQIRLFEILNEITKNWKDSD